MLRDGEFRYRGYRFGYAPVVVTEIEGLIGSTVRVGDRDIPRGDGAVPGAHWLGPKTPILDAVVTRRDELPRLLAALRPSRTVELPLTFGWYGEQRRVWARVVGVDVQPRPGSVRVRISLRCSDPRVYSDAEQSAPLVAYAPGQIGYFDYPDDYPKDTDTRPQTDSVATNEGDSDAFPILRVTGPSSGETTKITVVNRTNGSRIEVATTLLPGQMLTCRMRAFVTGHTDQLIVDVGGADRYAHWTTRPEVLRLSPGDNILRMLAEGDTPSGALLTWRHTWDGTVEDDLVTAV